ncbi:MAG TPA: FapA family protein [Halanaerobiales bacterium]|nr:FapA family protein [Halanaerobiales bacterium]
MDSLVVKAASKEKAAQKAYQKLSKERKIKLRDLKVEEKDGMFSGLRSKKRYQITLHPKKDINFNLLRNALEIDKKLALDIGKVVKTNLSTYQKNEEAELIIKKSADKMKAFVDYIPPQGLGEDFTEEDIKAKLKANDIVYGLKDYGINLILESEAPLEDIVIAEGKAAQPGEDARLEFHFDRSGKNVGTVQEDGSIDFHDLGIVNNVEAGEKLVSKIEATEGEEGKNIEGKTITPEKPEDVKLPKGENTEITEDNTLVSTEVGHISYKNDKVNILTVYKVQGDVDFNTGNIDFNGSVFIEGNVTEGFEVKAEGDIHVRGNVEGAHLKCSGDITINKNFIAKNKGEIECEGNLTTKTVQNGTVNCKGDVFVKDAIMHSKIHAAGSIELTGHKGLIVGGEVRATKEVKANIIGSSLATKTIVSAGIDPHTRSRCNKAKENLTECKSNYLKTVKAINILNQMKEKYGQLPEEKANMYDRLIETKSDLKEKINKNEKTVNELSEKINKATQGEVMVKRKVYPGVKVQIGKYHHEVDEVHTRTVFKVEEGELRRFGL